MIMVITIIIIVVNDAYGGSNNNSNNCDVYNDSNDSVVLTMTRVTTIISHFL